MTNMPKDKGIFCSPTCSFKKRPTTRKFKLVLLVILILVLIFVGGVVLYTFLVSAIDRIFVYPALNTINVEKDNKSKPIFKLHNTLYAYYSLSDIPILKVNNDKDNISGKLIKSSTTSFDSKLMINNEPFAAFGISIIPSDKKIKFIFNKLFSHKKLNEIAKESAIIPEVKYNFLSPLENLKKITLRIIMSTSIHKYYDLEFSAFNDSSFLICYSIMKESKLVGVNITLFKERSWKTVNIFSKAKNNESNLILLSIIEDMKTAQTHNIQPINKQ